MEPIPRAGVGVEVGIDVGADVEVDVGGRIWLAGAEVLLAVRPGSGVGATVGAGAEEQPMITRLIRRKQARVGSLSLMRKL